MPSQIERYLRERLVDAKQPYCMRVGADGRFAEGWGAAAAYGLEGLHAGDDVRGALPFLESGLDGAVELPFITDSQGRSFHAHVVPSGQDFYVLLIDARRELEDVRKAQQQANEVKLLLARERRMIAELVDAKAELSLRRKEAEAESRRRGEYIATMSHEFRTPLMALAAHAERLARDATPAGKASAEAIRRIAQQQIWLVDNLLTGAKLEAQGFAIHAEPADLRALIDDLSLVFAPLAAESGLSFAAFVAPSVPDLVVVDDLHLRQVLINLLGNAVKFTAAGGVTLECAYRDGRSSFTVTDTGPGIAKQDQVRLFTAFERGGEAPRKAGAGLGLAITRALVEAMRGTIALDSDLGRGTRVHLEMPAAAWHTAADPFDPAGVTSIMIAEDDPDVAELIALRLEDAGYRVQVMDNGRAVVDAALATPPDLLIIDTNLPGLDGPSAARLLRERGFAAPILALSAASRRQDIEHALASGCTQFLRKPAHPETLKRVVRELVVKAAAPIHSS